MMLDVVALVLLGIFKFVPAAVPVARSGSVPVVVVLIVAFVAPAVADILASTGAGADDLFAFVAALRLPTGRSGVGWWGRGQACEGGQALRRAARFSLGGPGSQQHGESKN